MDDDEQYGAEEEPASGLEAEAEEWWRRQAGVTQLFSPAAPIDRRALFAGRTRQIEDLLEVVYQRGQHAVLYGERGVGKTSLATVLAEIVQSIGSTGEGEKFFMAPRTNCDGTDTFSSVWRKVLGEVRIKRQVTGLGFKSEFTEVVQTAEALLSNDQVTPNDVKGVLQLLATLGRTVVIIDEFDQMADPGTTALFAATIKMLSDLSIPATVVLVGVADNVDQLIAEHQSVERALVQIRMPRMSPDELADILHKGLHPVGMGIDPGANSRITRLSQGLPQYTHSLGLYSAQTAIRRRSLRVTGEDVTEALNRAVEKAQESIIKTYARATHSTRQTLYPQVLLACALAKGDDLGYFGAPDVRGPLSRIMNRRYEIPAFAQHLNDFCSEERGAVLNKVGQTRSYRFRFTNPLLQPYVIMHGISKELADHSMLESIGE